MSTHKVTAPAAGFTGEAAGVYFKDGVAHVDIAIAEERAALAYFRRRGYRVEDTSNTAPTVAADSPVRPKDYAPKADWVAYAVSLGASATEAEAMTKTDLVDKYGNNSNEEDNS